MATVQVNCDGCAARGPSCGDCVMSVLLDGPSGVTELLDEERRALDALADAGLVPPLRLLPTPPSQMFGDRLRVV